MARGDAITWPQWEEKNLPHWLFQHRKLSWKARSKAYFRQYRIKRSGESLRGKQNDLRRRSRMQNEPVTPQPQATPRRTLLPHRHATASLPSFTLHDSSLKVYRLLEAIREAGAIRWSPLLKISTRRRKQGSKVHFPRLTAVPPPQVMSYYWGFVHRRALDVRPQNQTSAS